MENYIYCIDNEINKVKNIISILDNNHEKYEEYKKGLLNYIGNSVFWIITIYDKINYKFISKENKDLFLGIRALYNQLKHNLDFIELQEQTKGVNFNNLDFNNITFAREIVFADINFIPPKEKSKLTSFNYQVKCYKNILLGNQVLPFLQKAFLYFKEKNINEK